MNKGFMLYEALVMFIIVSFLIITCLNINHKIMLESKELENKIDKIFKKNNQVIKDCDYKCLIVKALLH